MHRQIFADAPRQALRTACPVFRTVGFVASTLSTRLPIIVGGIALWSPNMIVVEQIIDDKAVDAALKGRRPLAGNSHYGGERAFPGAAATGSPRHSMPK